MESCVRIRAGDSYWLAPLDCCECEVRNEMVPRVLNYEREVRRGWTTSGRFVEPCDILKAMEKLCKNIEGEGRRPCFLMHNEKGFKKG